LVVEYIGSGLPGWQRQSSYAAKFRPLPLPSTLNDPTSSTLARGPQISVPKWLQHNQHNSNDNNNENSNELNDRQRVLQWSTVSRHWNDVAFQERLELAALSLNGISITNIARLLGYTLTSNKATQSSRPMAIIPPNSDEMVPFHGIQIYGAGRTDAGVHALASVCHIDIPTTSQLVETNQLPFSCQRLLIGMNSQLSLHHHLFRRANTAPATSTSAATAGHDHITKVERRSHSPLQIRSVNAVSSSFHARHTAEARTYLYRLTSTSYGSVTASMFEHGRLWHVPTLIDIDKLRAAAAVFEGRHDFAVFRSSLCRSPSTIRVMERINVEVISSSSSWLPGPPVIHITIRGTTFLHNQVRLFCVRGFDFVRFTHHIWDRVSYFA
jgi:tRNA pseudouridine(38-40) synthase